MTNPDNVGNGDPPDPPYPPDSNALSDTQNTKHTTNQVLSDPAPTDKNHDILRFPPACPYGQEEERDQDHDTSNDKMEYDTDIDNVLALIDTDVTPDIPLYHRAVDTDNADAAMIDSTDDKDNNNNNAATNTDHDNDNDNNDTAPNPEYYTRLSYSTDSKWDTSPWSLVSYNTKIQQRSTKNQTNPSEYSDGHSTPVATPTIATPTPRRPSNRSIATTTTHHNAAKIYGSTTIKPL